MQVARRGYDTALSVLKKGRAAFFGGGDVDLPKNRPLKLKDDLTPSFGYVGERYSPKTGVLILGINPGNGSDVRSEADEQLYPALISFTENPSQKHFAEAQQAYKAACVTWPVWRRHCSEFIGAGKLELEEVAYSNCLPWRTESKSGFAPSVAEKAAKLYAYPLIEELQPKLIIALGKRAEEILLLAGQKLPARLITWNRAQAATPAVLKERAKAAAEILDALRR